MSQRDSLKQIAIQRQQPPREYRVAAVNFEVSFKRPERIPGTIVLNSLLDAVWQVGEQVEPSPGLDLVHTLDEG